VRILKQSISKIKIFISYANEDFEIAKRLYIDLKKQGYLPWLDKIDLVPGQYWDLEIQNQIKNSDFFLLLLSSRSISKRGFIQNEVKKGLDILEECAPSDIFFIPVRIEDCEPEYEKLKKLHWANLFPSYEEGLQSIIKVIKKKYDDTGGEVDELTSQYTGPLESRGH